MCFCCYSLTQLCPTLCDPMDCSTPYLPVPRHLLKFTQVPVLGTSDAIQPSHPLLPSSPSTLNLSQHKGLFQWVSCLHQMTKIQELIYIIIYIIILYIYILFLFFLQIFLKFYFIFKLYIIVLVLPNIIYIIYIMYICIICYITHMYII